MIKKIIVILLTLALIGSYAISDINNVYAYTTSEENGRFMVDDFRYQIISENTVEIDNYCSHSSASLKIPEYVDYNGITYSVTSIGKEAFRYSYLTNITIPDGVTSIGEGAFRDCWGLKSITIPDSVTSIGPFAFHSCSSLMNIKIPNGVKIIERSTFGNCSSLMKVTLPDGLTSIGYYSFKACTYLTDINIPDSVTYIDEYAFTECKYLTNLKIPNSVIYIGRNAFLNCDGTFEPESIVLTLLVEENSYASQYAEREDISYKIYTDNSKFVEGQLTYKVLSDNTVEVDNCDGTAIEVEIPEYVLHDGVNYKVTKIGSAAFYDCLDLQSVTIPNSITSIDGYAFSGCESLTNISILNNVTTIGDYAFAECTSLTNISLSDSVISIGDCAFSDCTSLKTISLSDRLTSIGAYAFSNCSSLTDFSIPDSVTSVGDHAFSDCKSLANVSISNSMTNIEEYTFYNCTSLTNVTIPNGVKAIGIYAFCYCSSLTNVTLPDSLTEIEYGVFNDCDNLERIRIPSSVTYMNSSMFGWSTIVLQVENDSYALQFALNNRIAYEIYTDNPRFVDGQLTYEILSDTTVEVDKCNRKASEVKVPEYVVHNGIKYRVVSIGNAAFYYCKDLKSVTMPNSVTTIGAWAYGECSSLTSVTMPNSVTKIEAWAYDECSSLTNITIPKSVKRIEEEAFKYCTSLKKVTISSGTTDIDEDAFLWCYKLKFYVELGSYALRYAIDSNIPYVITGNGSKSSYPDVKTTDWYYRVVEIATATGLMGVENKKTGSFSPNKNISRGMVATILYRMADSPAVTYTDKFPDVKENVWYSDAIIWANKVGIVNGYQNGKFGPDDNITREQFAMMLYKYALKVAKISMYEKVNLNIFKDANGISSYAKSALQWAVGERIISGKENGTKIAARDNATRAECAKMIVAFQDLIIAKKN